MTEAKADRPAGGALELLAPAGDFEALQAAIEAGAEAVYLGLRTLNARRRARNFTQDEFVGAVAAAHARGVRVYLTLNTDLSERELGQAARILELARQCRADAVLVRDPALLALRPLYPEIPFHFSTQTCTANTADVAAAAELGAARVVLAREMSLPEIAAASAVPDVQTEVFAQGALCFCVSGRCLLSSWVGGRSGNRGACTSPCRVPWTIGDRPAGTPLSMRDLAAIERLDDLRKAGVSAIKIEGRLKNAAWVRRAVALYRRALDGEDPAALRPEVEQLGTYTGRDMTCAYLDARRDELTGYGRGRQPAERAPGVSPGIDGIGDAPGYSGANAPGSLDDAPASLDEEMPRGDTGAEPAADTFDLEVDVGRERIAVRCTCAGQTTEWPVTKTVVHRQHKAVSIGDLFARLSGGIVEGHRAGRLSTNDPDYLLVPRASNALIDRIATAIRQARKGPDQLVRVELPEPVRELLEKLGRAEANCRHLGQSPDRVRLGPNRVAEFLRNVRVGGVIVEGLSPGRLDRLLSACDGTPLVAALPQVFFEEDIGNIRRLLRDCKAARVSVEVNSWGGWLLAKRAGVRIESGPGLPVLNGLAARALHDRGVRCVTLSPEADRRQLEELAAQCPAPCSLTVFGRPPLMVTRVEFRDEELEGKVLEDRRGVQMTARRERGLWVFRPVQPFDLRGLANERIRVQHLVVDLVGSPDPLGDWFDVPLPHFRTFRLNYDRSLG